jgi:putative alpha-1,2-mannosidase
MPRTATTEGSSRIEPYALCRVGRQPVYIIGIPTFASVTVRLGPAAKLQILRVGQGAYVQSATLDAAPLNGRGWLHVAEVHGGGGGGGGGAQVLRLTMGGTPSSEWGRQRPPNFRVPDTMES